MKLIGPVVSFCTKNFISSLCAKVLITQFLKLCSKKKQQCIEYCLINKKSVKLCSVPSFVLCSRLTLDCQAVMDFL